MKWMEIQRMYKSEEEYQLMLGKLKEICKQKNMSQYALAKATGMSTSSMSSLMKGETRPYIHSMLMICEALDVSIGELFDNKVSGDDVDEETFTRIYRCLTPEKRKVLKVYMDMLMQYNGEL